MEFRERKKGVLPFSFLWICKKPLIFGPFFGMGDAH
ncbi:Hypothetical protein Minf_0465 [Methylacidiphilum infernorum V4]|uniref:Uncharacterized protein n=1 Tax=Methylacidiphilum infernorum (isolate V4) TaxID=481448 RepID=B3DZA6_METI4|nr:Hypothetical protein Minf_0465 [Methylacidiphilum infernorum V4]